MCVTKHTQAGFVVTGFIHAASKLAQSVPIIIAPWKKIYDKQTSIKKQCYHFSNQGPFSQRYGFSSSHVRMSELDHKEG